MDKKVTEYEAFADRALRRVWDIENGVDDVDFSEHTIRVCIAHMRQDLALLVFTTARARDDLKTIQILLGLIILLGVIAIWHLW